MAKTVEEAIRHAVERGEFVHLSVHPRGKDMYRATFAGSSAAGGYRFAESKDPATAIVDAIMSTPMARKSAGKIAEPDDQGDPALG